MKNKKLRTKEIKALVTKFREKREMLCYFCGSKATKSARRVEEVKCSWKACKKRYNLWFGTIFYNTQLKYKKIIQILELWLQRASIDIISFVCRVGKKNYSEIA